MGLFDEEVWEGCTGNNPFYPDISDAWDSVLYHWGLSHITRADGYFWSTRRTHFWKCAGVYYILPGDPFFHCGSGEDVHLIPPGFDPMFESTCVLRLVHK